MPWRFPSVDALTLALTSGAVPAPVAMAPLQAGWDDQGGVTVVAGQEFATEVQQNLLALGATEVAAGGLELMPLAHWLQLLPLQRVAGPPQLTDKSPVLFDIAPQERLGEVVGEILRLGNDRQSFRHLASDAATRTLLRVIGPPFYTLLRALEPGSNGSSSRLPAYYEQRPRVWVELGYAHPLAEQIEPPPGKWLLLRSPRVWELLDEGAFQEVYGALEFKLPRCDSEWRERPLAERLPVRLRLTAMAETDAAELWVLEQEAWQQIEQLVAHSDNELLGRLAFAVVEQNAESLVILRVRPSKLPPPVLVLRGVACRSYLNLPNLYVPVGKRLHPPLRRDAVAQLLAGDGQRTVWLHPGANGEFTPRSVPDAAFRPLAQWVDYVLDHEAAALTAWTASHRFDFTSFICADDAPQRAKPTIKEKVEQPAKPQAAVAPAPVQTPPADDDEPILAEIVEEPVSDPRELLRDLPQPSELQQRLAKIEQQFLAQTTPPEAPERRGLWLEMGRLNGQLDRQFDATLCWTHALWESAPTNQAPPTWLRDLQDGDFPSASVLESLLQEDPTRRIDATRMAMQIIAAGSSSDASAIRDRLGLAARVLERYEHALPIRLVWLAWVAIAQMTNHDALALARARDRLLERLHVHGITPEHDVPGFLRAGSGGDADRQRVLRERLVELRELVAEWIQEPPSSLARTRAYADLVFAYGLARLGEGEKSQLIAGWARKQMGRRDTLHHWTQEAYEHRIAEARRGGRGSQLPADLLTIMEAMERVDRYKADRLREHSRIIEPFERIDPYRRWHRHFTDDLDRELGALFDLMDGEQLRQRLGTLLSSTSPTASEPRNRTRVLTTALELAPRLGEAFAAGLVGRVLPACDAAGDIADEAWLLEKGLQMAAHYDQHEAVQAYVERFERSLPAIVEGYLHLQTEHNPERQRKLVTIEGLFNQSLRGLRKLGLRDEISRIFSRIVQLVHASARAPTPTPRGKGRPAQQDTTRADKLLLAVAGGWYYFGQLELAGPVVQEVRKRLFQEAIPPIAKASLACAYVTAVGQAPLEIALPLVHELFENDSAGQRRLTGVADSYTTSTHFSLSQLDIVEAAVLTLASDECLLSSETRQWLEEDEFLVRRRIHRDVREMLAQAGH